MALAVFGCVSGRSFIAIFMFPCGPIRANKHMKNPSEYPILTVIVSEMRIAILLKKTIWQPNMHSPAPRVVTPPAATVAPMVRAASETRSFRNGLAESAYGCDR